LLGYARNQITRRQNQSEKLQIRLKSVAKQPELRLPARSEKTHGILIGFRPKFG
jgi:hypothetical protein